MCQISKQSRFKTVNARIWTSHLRTIGEAEMNFWTAAVTHLIDFLWSTTWQPANIREKQAFCLCNFVSLRVPVQTVDTEYHPNRLQTDGSPAFSHSPSWWNYLKINYFGIKLNCRTLLKEVRRRKVGLFWKVYP